MLAGSGKGEVMICSALSGWLELWRTAFGKGHPSSGLQPVGQLHCHRSLLLAVADVARNRA
jgi:hypothetical protein